MCRVERSERARDSMLKATDTKHAPWHIVRTDDKRRGRLNCISHILAQIPYKKIAKDKVKLPKRSTKDKYDDQVPLMGRKFVSEPYRIKASSATAYAWVNNKTAKGAVTQPSKPAASEQRRGFAPAHG